MDQDRCLSCINWDKDGERPGIMPGVREEYRRCLRTRFVKSQVVEWRSPKDWCNQYEKRTQPVKAGPVEEKTET